MILETILRLRDASATNEKISILRENLEVPNLCDILSMTYDPFQNTFVKKLPKIESYGDLSLSTEDGFRVFKNLFERLTSRTVTGHAAIADIEAELSKFNQDESALCGRVILKDLKLKMNTSLINRAAGREVVREYKTQLSNEYELGKKYSPKRFMYSPKLDGIRCGIHPNATILTRTGKDLVGFDAIAEAVVPLLRELGLDRLDGELHFEDPRQERDEKGMPIGIDKFHAVQSIVLSSKNIDMKKKDSIYFHAFAVVGDNGKVFAEEEFKELLNKFSDTPRVKVLEYGEIENDEVKITELSVKLFEGGYEGVMLRDPEKTFDFKRSNALLKKKPFYESDFEIVEILAGAADKRLGETMGKVVIRGTYDEKPIECEVGSGWTDSVRDDIWNDKNTYIGKLIEVQFQGVEMTEESKAKGVYSLRFPTFQKLKLDRDIEDTVDEM